MARLPRLTVPGYAHHVIHRGNNRQPIVLDDADRERLLDLIRDHAQRQRVALHAWVIMDNHLHLLLTPSTDDGLPAMMQGLGRAYVRYFNDRHHRTGTLWEGRYRSTLVDSERYLLACMAYIDLNPVRAGLVPEARQYPWSSHRHHVGLTNDRSLTPHAVYWALGNTPFAREAAYADWVNGGLASAQVAQLTDAALKGWPLGDESFRAALQARTPRRLVPARAGRPRRIPDAGGQAGD